MPIGLINTDVGGTAAQRWTPKEVLQSTPELEKYAGERNPSDLYNAMIHPLLNYGIRGAIWYQGESNAGDAIAYRVLFPAMIKSCAIVGDRVNSRSCLCRSPPGKCPTTQANRSGPNLREAQLMTLSKSPNTAMAVITDVGDAKDIHPKQKQPVGERLALPRVPWPMAKRSNTLAPSFESMATSGERHSPL